MFCPKCGTQNPDGAKFCAGCGQLMQANTADPQAQAGAQAPVPQPAQVGAQADVAPQPQAGAASIAAKPISRRNLIIGAGLGIVAIGGVAFGLTRCTGGFGGGVIPKAEQEGLPTALSKGLKNGRVIWYCIDGSVETNGVVDRALVFENNKVTQYVPWKSDDNNGATDVTLADLKDLSDDEIIAKLKEWDEQRFEQRRANAAEKIQKSAPAAKSSDVSAEVSADDIASFNEESAMCADEFDQTPITYDELKAAYENISADDISATLDSLVEKVNAAEYEAPEAVDYQLLVAPDGTGNAASIEAISFAARTCSFSSGFDDVGITSMVEDLINDPYGYSWEILDIYGLMDDKGCTLEEALSGLASQSSVEGSEWQDLTVSILFSVLNPTVSGQVYDNYYSGMSCLRSAGENSSLYSSFIAKAEDTTVYLGLDTPSTEGIEISQSLEYDD